jgi:excisionase family DNA binding protein
LNLRKPLIYRLLREGRLPMIRMTPRSTRIPRAALAALLAVGEPIKQESD